MLSRVGTHILRASTASNALLAQAVQSSTPSAEKTAATTGFDGAKRTADSDEENHHSCSSSSTCCQLVGIALTGATLGAAHASHEAIDLLRSYRQQQLSVDDRTYDGLGASLCAFRRLTNRVYAKPTLLSGHGVLPLNNRVDQLEDDDVSLSAVVPPPPSKKSVRFAASTQTEPISVETEEPVVSLNEILDEGVSELGRCSAALDNAIGLDCLRQGLKEEALRYFRRGADVGDANAIFNWAQCHHRGYGTVRNISKAVNLWQRAAKLGHKEAQYQLDICSLKGIGGVTKCDSSYIVSATTESTTAQAAFFGGVCRLREQDVVGGMSLIRRAADMKDARAVAFLKDVTSTTVVDVPMAVKQDASEWLQCYDKVTSKEQIKPEVKPSRFWSPSSDDESDGGDGLSTVSSSRCDSQESVCFSNDVDGKSAIEFGSDGTKQPALTMKKAVTVHDFRSWIAAATANEGSATSL